MLVNLYKKMELLETLENVLKLNKTMKQNLIHPIMIMVLEAITREAPSFNLQNENNIVHSLKV